MMREFGLGRIAKCDLSGLSALTALQHLNLKGLSDFEHPEQSLGLQQLTFLHMPSVLPPIFIPLPTTSMCDMCRVRDCAIHVENTQEDCLNLQVFPISLQGLHLPVLHSLDLGPAVVRKSSIGALIHGAPSLRWFNRIPFRHVTHEELEGVVDEDE